MYETWASDLDDWDSREYDNEDLIDALYTVRSSPLLQCSQSPAIPSAHFLACADCCMERIAPYPSWSHQVQV